MKIMESQSWMPATDGQYVVDQTGNPITFYHGTNRNFPTEEFRATVGSFGKGIYFANNERDAKSFGNRMITVHLRMSNPYFTDGRVDGDVFSQSGTRERLVEQGYDGVLYCLSHDYIEAVVFSPDQITSYNPDDPVHRSLPLTEGQNKIVSGDQLMARYGGRRMAYEVLPDLYQKSLTQWMVVEGDNDDYTEEEYGVVEVPMNDILMVIFNQLGEGQTFEQFWGEGKAGYGKAYSERWPIIWSDMGWEDGMHRLTTYRARGEVSVPVVVV